MNNDTASHTPTPSDQTPDPITFQWWWENNKKSLSGLEPYFFAHAGFRAGELAQVQEAALLKAEVERLRAGISSLLKNRPYCHHMAVSGIDEYQELAPVDDCGCSACASVRSALSLVSESTTQGS